MGLVCGNCGEANRDGARFCGHCGLRLAARCRTCDAELTADLRFCDSCGAPVSDEPETRAPTDQARKTVTVLFADLAGSTSMQEDMDPEAVRAFNARYYAAMQAAVEDHGGRVVKFVGDAVMAVFGVPEVAEDDARRALAAATAMHEAFAVLDTDRLGLRIGINTGEVVVEEGDDDVVGDTVNVASRLEHAAPAGAVLVGDETYRLTREHATFGVPQHLQVRGRGEPVVARVLQSLTHPPGDTRATFVGRHEELTALVAALGTAEATGRTRLVTVVGSPGVGKSRLLDELAAAVDDAATILQARCDASSTATFAPIGDVVRGAIDVHGDLDTLLADDPERDRVANAIGALVGEGEPETPQETFWAVRRVIEATARRRPTVVVLDDLHWAEPLLLDLVEHLAEWLGESPVLLVAAARPELRELRPALVEVGARPTSVLSLEGLDPDATSRLAAELLGSGALPAEVAARVVAATEGNPLFVRELVRMLVDDGVLRADGDRWVVTVDAQDIDVPPTITSLLAARLERLRADERMVLERASVIGHEVFRGALVDLLPVASRVRLDAVLESLRRKELLEPAGSYWIDEPVLRFHHALIREAAYRRLLKEARAELHERVVSWFTAKTGGGAEHDELVGFHLEQAQANQRELGPLDDHGRAVASEAASRLAGAAHRALHRDDLPAAATLSGRALACLEGDDTARPELLLVRCEAVLGIGDMAASRVAVDDLAARAAGDQRLSAWATAFAVQLATLTGGADLDESGRLASEAADQLTAIGDPTGAAKAHRVHASVLARLGRVADTEAALDRALTAAREAGDNRQISGVLAAAPVAALWGPSPVPRAGGRCLDVVRLLRITTGARAVEAISTRCQAVLEAFRGRDEAARKMLGSARATLEDLGLRHGLLELELFAGIVELAAGDAAAADEHLRLAHDGFRDLGIEVDAAQAAGLRARAALDLGDDDRALELAEAAERLGGRDLKTAIAWRATKAVVLARRGDHAAAVELAQAATALAEPTDALVDRADAQAALGAVLALAGDADGARRATGRARALYEQKGANALVERLGGGITSSEASDRPAADAHVVRDNLAAAVERRMCQLLVEQRWDDIRAALSPEFRWHERRRGLQVGSLDVEAAIANGVAMVDVGLAALTVEVVEVRGERLALVREVASGDDFEVELLVVAEVDNAGLLFRDVVFDADALDAAIAELNQLATTSSLENTATRAYFKFTDAVVRGDAERLPRKSTFAFEDRRQGMETTVTGIEEGLEATAGMPQVARVDREVLAVRGDLLCLARARYEYADSAFVIEMLTLVGTDGQGLEDIAVLFDTDDLADALLELDELYAAGEGAAEADAIRTVARRVHAVNTRQWDRVTELSAPDIVDIDHRPASFGESHGVAGTIERLRSMEEVAPDLVFVGRRVLDICDGVVLCERSTHSGAAEEPSSVSLVVLVTRDGRVTRYEVFPAEAEAVARARFEELATKSPMENQATRAFNWFRDEMLRGRRPRIPSGHFLHDDRRRDLGIGVTADTLEGMPPIARLDRETLAVRGERLCLAWSKYQYADSNFETESLAILGTDEEGTARFGMVFEPADLADALLELDERYAAGEGAAEADAVRAVARFVHAVNTRQWDRVTELSAPDIVDVDHRPASFGESHGVAGTIERLRSMAEVAPDWVLVGRRVLELRDGVVLCARSIQAGAGAEPSSAALVVLVTRDGGVARYEVFPADAEAAARARFEELAGRAELTNAAARTLETWEAAFVEQRWDDLATLFADDFVHVDRRTVIGGDHAEDAATIDERGLGWPAMGVTDIRSSVIAVRGDHLVLRREVTVLPRGYELELLHLCEVDDAGRQVYEALFDADDLIGAMSNLDDRFLPSVPVEAAASADIQRRANDAINSGDRATLESLLAPEFVIVDNHVPGLGSLDRASAITALAEMAGPGHVLYAEDILVFDEHGSVTRSREIELNQAGGVAEYVILMVVVVAGGLITRTEYFPEHDVDAALARYAELTAGPSRFENAATRSHRGWIQAFEERRWDDIAAMQALAGVVFEDSRSVVGGGAFLGIEESIELQRALARDGVDQVSCTIVATRGEHLALTRDVYGGASYESEVLQLTEVDDRGRFTYGATFDPEHLAGAIATLDERYEQLVAAPQLLATVRDVLFLRRLGTGGYEVVERAPSGELERLGQFAPDELGGALTLIVARCADLLDGADAERVRATLPMIGLDPMNGQDWDALAEQHDEAHVAIDHRPAALGVIEGRQAWVEVTRHAAELAPDIRYRISDLVGLEVGRMVAVEITTGGSSVEGLVFERVFLCLFEFGETGLLVRTELFGTEERAAALARFDELTGR